jgi:hypothetical protein
MLILCSRLGRCQRARIYPHRPATTRLHDRDSDEPTGCWGRVQWGRAPACPREPFAGGLPRLSKSDGPSCATQRPREGRPELPHCSAGAQRHQSGGNQSRDGN